MVSILGTMIVLGRQINLINNSIGQQIDFVYFLDNNHNIFYFIYNGGCMAEAILCRGRRGKVRFSSVSQGEHIANLIIFMYSTYFGR